MDQFNEEQLNQLLSENKLDEAKEMITQVLDRPLTSEEKGAALVTLAAAYIKASNEANKRYEQALDDVLASLKKIDETQSQANDQIDIAATQQQISEME